MVLLGLTAAYYTISAAESPPHFAKCGGRQQRDKTAADATATAANMAGDLWAPFIVPYLSAAVLPRPFHAVKHIQ